MRKTFARSVQFEAQKVRMKITVEISDSLLREVRRVAAREGLTFRTLVERGLHRVVAETKRGPPFRLRRATFNGTGRQPEFRDVSWDRVRDTVHGDRSVNHDRYS